MEMLSVTIEWTAPTSDQLVFITPDKIAIMRKSNNISLEGLGFLLELLDISLDDFNRVYESWKHD